MIIKFDTVNNVSGFIALSSIAKKAEVQYVDVGFMVAMRIEAMREMAAVRETRRRTWILETRRPVAMSVRAAMKTMGRKRRDVCRAVRCWMRWKLDGGGGWSIDGWG